MLCNNGTASAGPQTLNNKKMGFSPCTQPAMELPPRTALFSSLFSPQGMSFPFGLAPAAYPILPPEQLAGHRAGAHHLQSQRGRHLRIAALRRLLRGHRHVRSTLSSAGTPASWSLDAAELLKIYLKA